MRRLEILEPGNGGECGCSGCCERPCSVDGTQSNCRAGCRTCADCRQDRPQENRGVSGAESEGRAGRPDSLVLPGLRQEFYCICSRSAGGMPQPSRQIRKTEKRITSYEQAPINGGLPCLVVKKTTIPP